MNIWCGFRQIFDYSKKKLFALTICSENDTSLGKDIFKYVYSDWDVWFQENSSPENFHWIILHWKIGEFFTSYRNILRPNNSSLEGGTIFARSILCQIFTQSKKSGIF
jgi:hypothetical protein